MGNYNYVGTISQDPLVDKYQSGGKVIYALTIPAQTGRVGTYTFDLGRAVSAILYKPRASADAMTQTPLKAIKGKVTLQLTETPSFLQVETK
jgi:hypothetical protein